MVSNFTVQDVLGILRVLPFFSLTLVAPGYLIGLASNVLDFRQRGISERLLLSVAISAAVSPYAINILCRFFPVGAVSVLFLLLGVAFIARLLLEWKRSNYTLQIEMHKTTKIAICLVFAWIAACLFSLPDLQLGQKIYSSVALYDYSVRSPLIASALRTGAPPASPFFYPGHFVPVRYYYYWNVLCALPAWMSRGSARVTLYASCIWSGLLLASMIPIFLKHFLEQTSKLRIASVAGIAMLAVTGLDLIPTLGFIVIGHLHPPPDLELWDPVQITSWVGAFIWVPHHVAALAACLAAYLFLWKATGKGEFPARIWLIALAALGLSSAAGLSVYVTFTFGAFMLAWVAYLLLRGRFSAALLYGAAGGLALLLSIAYLRDILGGATSISGSGASNGHFVTFALRQLFYFHEFQNTFKDICLWAVLAFLVISLELGIYMLIGLIQANRDWRHWRSLSEAQKALWIMSGTSLLVIMFLRSTVLRANDLAFRGALVMQFVLLLWAAAYLTDRFTTRRQAPARGWSDDQILGATLCMLLSLGGAATVYQLAILRVFPLLAGRYHWQDYMEGEHADYAFALRSAYAELDRTEPANAIVQYNPASPLINQTLYYSRYQQAASDINCNTNFGGSVAECAPVQAGLQAIFDAQDGDSSKAEVDKICGSLGINVLLVSSLDPVWNRKDSWVWQDTPMIQGELVRFYRCGNGL